MRRTGHRLRPLGRERRARRAERREARQEAWEARVRRWKVWRQNAADPEYQPVVTLPTLGMSLAQRSGQIRRNPYALTRLQKQALLRQAAERLAEVGQEKAG